LFDKKPKFDMRKMMMLVAAQLLIAAAVMAQKTGGTVKDEQGKPLAGATVSLKKAKDSAVVKLAVTNPAGKYEFANITPGNYFVAVSFVGYMPASSPVFEVSGSGETNAPDLAVAKAAGNLKGVTVTSKKPMIEVKADKTILNVEGSINAVGQDALELLRKSPGVMVDKDDNITLAGKNGVQVYIDGKPSPLAGADLAAYLKNMQSAQIEAIEIITNPSAKYEAAGNAGIINIRLKKNKSYGIFSKYNAGLSLNNRNKRMNVFGNYNYNRARNESFMNLYRKQLDTLFDQKGTMNFRNSGHGFKVGADYFINKRSTIGLLVNGNLGNSDFGNYSRTPISYIPTGVVSRVLIADNSSISERNNANFNINYRYADTSGRELNMDADYGVYRIKSDQMQPNFYFDPTGSILQSKFVYNMVAPTNIDIYAFKTDYEQNFKKGRLGIGGKISYVKSGNNFERYNIISSGKTLDTLRSNNFNYTENINALYVNYNRAFKGFMIQVGLRAENTNSEGRSDGYKQNGSGYKVYDSTFTRHYTNLFPSAAITFNKNPMSQWSLSYSRRIDRPAYQDLNPFEFKLDEYTFQKGNTELRPQYTNSFGVSHTYKYRLTTQLNYSHVNDVFTQLIDTAEKSKSFITKKNLATQDIVSMSISYPFQYKSYSAFATLSGNYSHYKANFGTGRTIDLDAVSFNFYAQQSIRFAKTWTAEMSGWYASPGIWQGTFESKEMWAIDMGLQKSIMQNRGTVKVSVSDIFQTMRWAGTSNFAGQFLRAGGGWESRQFKLNLNWRFGNTQVKAARQRKQALDDESKRVGNQGGGLSN
jgi:iron complex outermembrane recepter protein